MTNNIAVIIENDATPVLLSGRDAWALLQLMQAGAVGCTHFDNPEPRWSAHVHNLREFGLKIEAIHEPHGAPFPGTYPRYVLRSDVYVLAQA